MKAPAACKSLADIRVAVNAVDRDIVRLLAKRSRYAAAALRFKTDVKSVGDPEHRKRLFAQRTAWAKADGLDVALMTRIYRAIVAESKRVHLAGLRARRRKAPR